MEDPVNNPALSIKNKTKSTVRNRSILAIVTLSAVLVASCGKKDKEQTTTTAGTQKIAYTVLNVLPHNPQAFTQGLIIHNNKILESTGQPNTSWIAEVNPGTGEHDKKVNLPGEYFGEGITLLNNKIYQLTWQSNVGFIYDARTYQKLGQFTYDNYRQGWGLTHDNKNLILSDGTDKIYYLDTATLKTVRTLPVTEGGNRIEKINELEYINGYIYANVWELPLIIKIDPATGKVVGRLDLSRICNEISSMYPAADVLNGIAYDANSKALLVTGKLWPKAYLIRMQ